MPLNNGLPKIRKAWYLERMKAYYITCICGDQVRITEKDIAEKNFTCWSCITKYKMKWSEEDKTYVLTEN